MGATTEAEDGLPESIRAMDFSGAVLLSGSMWAHRHISSSSSLFFSTRSFIRLAFSLVNLSTSAAVCPPPPKKKTTKKEKKDY